MRSGRRKHEKGKDEVGSGEEHRWSRDWGTCEPTATAGWLQYAVPGCSSLWGLQRAHEIPANLSAVSEADTESCANGFDPGGHFKVSVGRD